MKNLKRKKFSAFTALILTACLLFSGCSDSSSEPDSQTSEDATVTIGYYASASLLDPQKTVDYTNQIMMNQMYDTLIVLDTDLQTVKSSLAKSWTVSDDGLTYDFILRDDVKFHSGKALTADDVVYSINRWMDEATASPSSYKMYCVSEVEAVNDYEVKITLSTPSNAFLTNLTTVDASILNKESVEAAGDTYGVTVVDGTGPFKFVELVADDKLVLTRNDDYAWAPEIFNNTGKPYIKDVVFRFIPEESTRIMELESGTIDILANTSVGYSYVSELENMDGISPMLFDEPYPCYIGLNLNNPILSDINVRKALNMATNKDDIITAAVNGYATAADGPLTPGYYGYDENISSYAYSYDVDKAGKLLDKAGWKLNSDGYRYKDGEKLSFELTYGTGTDYKTIALTFQSQMLEIGCEVTLKEMDWSSIFTYINSGEQAAYIMDMFYIHPDDVMGTYFLSSNQPYPNRFGYSNTEVDKNITTGLTSTDESEALEAYAAAQQQVVEDAVWISLYHKKGLMAVSDKIQDLTAHASEFDGLPKLIDVTKTN